MYSGYTLEEETTKYKGNEEGERGKDKKGMDGEIEKKRWVVANVKAETMDGTGERMKARGEPGLWMVDDSGERR